MERKPGDPPPAKWSDEFEKFVTKNWKSFGTNESLVLSRIGHELHNAFKDHVRQVREEAAATVRSDQAVIDALKSRTKELEARVKELESQVIS